MANNEEKPSFAQLLQTAVDGRLCDLHTAMPGIVKSYDRATQTAKIQPALKRTYTDGTVVDLPIINKVPVIFPRSKGKWVHFDMEVDSVVTLIFGERSLDIWKEKGGLVSPNDPRKFHLSDAYAIPGGYPVIEPLAPNGGDGSIEIANGESHIVIEQDGKIFLKNEGGSMEIAADGKTTIMNEGGKIEMSTAGKFKITNNTNELVDLLVQLADVLSTTTTNTLLGPMKLNDFATIEQLKTKLETLKG